MGDRGGRHAPTMNRLVLAALHSRVLHSMLDHGLCQLRYTGRRSGRAVSLPVQYARHGTAVVVYVGDAAGKTWWRNFAQPYPVEVVIRGDRYHGMGHLVTAQAPDRTATSQIYRGVHPRARTSHADPFVLITLLTPP
jgi:hypothetical protein